MDRNVRMARELLRVARMLVADGEGKNEEAIELPSDLASKVKEFASYLSDISVEIGNIGTMQMYRNNNGAIRNFFENIKKLLKMFSKTAMDYESFMAKHHIGENNMPENSFSKNGYSMSYNGFNFKNNEMLGGFTDSFYFMYMDYGADFVQEVIKFMVGYLNFDDVVAKWRKHNEESDKNKKMLDAAREGGDEAREIWQNDRVFPKEAKLATYMAYIKNNCKDLTLLDKTMTNDYDGYTICPKCMRPVPVKKKGSDHRFKFCEECGERLPDDSDEFSPEELLNAKAGKMKWLAGELARTFDLEKMLKEPFDLKLK